MQADNTARPVADLRSRRARSRSVLLEDGSDGAGVSRTASLRTHMNNIQQDVAMWKEYGVEDSTDAKKLSVLLKVLTKGAKDLTLMEKELAEDKRRFSTEQERQRKNNRCQWVWMTAHVVFTVLLMAMFGLHVLYFDTFNWYHGHPLIEQRSQLSTQLARQSDSQMALATWLTKAEAEISSMKRSLRQVQTDMVTVKKEMENGQSESGAVQVPAVDMLAELLGPAADFAAAKNGGSVLATPDTDTYVGTPAVANLFGFNFYKNIQTTPSTILQGVLQPGDCWAYQGHTGRVVIKLARPVAVSAVSIEHIPEAVSVSGNIDSAPRHFSLIGMTAEMTDAVFLGGFEYDKDGQARQTFHIGPTEQRHFEAVEVQFLSNHGHPHYTCVYRVRVHGRA